MTPEHIQPYPKAADKTGKLQQGMENQNFDWHPRQSTDWIRAGQEM